MKVILFFLFSVLSYPALAIELGQGFLPNGELWTPQCVTGQLSFGGKQAGVINFENRSSKSLTLFNQAFETGIGSDFGVFGASGMIGIEQLVKLQDRSWYLTFTYDIVDSKASLRNIVPTVFGKKIHSYNNSVAFKQLCGEQFVSGLQRGTKVTLVARYTFKEKITSATFKWKIEVSVAGKTIKVPMQKTINGGDNPLQRFDLFVAVEGGQSVQIEQDVRELFAICDPFSTEGCAQSFSETVDYLNSESFHNLVTNEAGEPRDMNFTPYSTLIFPEDAPL